MGFKRFELSKTLTVDFETALCNLFGQFLGVQYWGRYSHGCRNIEVCMTEFVCQEVKTAYWFTQSVVHNCAASWGCHSKLRSLSLHVKLLNITCRVSYSVDEECSRHRVFETIFIESLGIYFDVCCSRTNRDVSKFDAERFKNFQKFRNLNLAKLLELLLVNFVSVHHNSLDLTVVNLLKVSY